MLIRLQLQMWKRKFSQDWIYPVIQQLVELPLSAITWSNHFLCGFESLTSVWRTFSPLFFTALIHWGLQNVCQTGGLTFDSRTLWHTEESMVDSVTTRCSCHVAAKTSPSHHPSSIVPTVGMRCLCWYAVGIFQTWCCAAKHLHFGLISSKAIPEVLWFLIYKLWFLERKITVWPPFQTSNTSSVFFWSCCHEL